MARTGDVHAAVLFVLMAVYIVMHAGLITALDLFTEMIPPLCRQRFVIMERISGPVFSVAMIIYRKMRSFVLCAGSR